jgi:iron(III) transport system substrate-binding protein
VVPPAGVFRLAIRRGFQRLQVAGALRGRQRFLATMPLLLGGLLLGACRAEESVAPGGEPAATATATPQGGAVTLYSGRSESLIAPLLERFGAATGVRVEVRYGDSAELAATLLEEGDRTPAQVYLSQDAAALGALASAGLLRELPEALVAAVPPRFTSGPDRLWVGVSGRARTVVYNSERVKPEALPQSLEEVADPRFRGRFGVAPSNASFQAHMAVYRAVHGAAALDRLLAGIAANEPRLFDRNGPIVDATLAGEIDWGLVNHYYLWRALEERPGAPGVNFFMPQGETSSFVNLAGVGLLRDTPEARRLIEYLLSAEAQRYFAEETFEYPVVPGVEVAAELLPLDQVRTPDVDFAEVSAGFEETLAAIRSSGLLP